MTNEKKELRVFARKVATVVKKDEMKDVSGGHSLPSNCTIIPPCDTICVNPNTFDTL